MNKVELIGHYGSDITHAQSAWTSTSRELNDEWQKWGVAEIMKRFKLKKSIAEREMGMIALNYGLKFSDFDKNK